MTCTATIHPDRTTPWEGLIHQDQIEVDLWTGETLRGAYSPIAGMHFVVSRVPGALLDNVEGPLREEDVLDVRVVRRWEAIKAERHASRRGEPFPGPAPRTALDYEYRLGLLAKAIASTEELPRRAQMMLQFEDLAAEIQLSAGKRQWMLAEGRWSLRSNAPPALEDLWPSKVASPSLMARPRPQDFDPDPVIRRKRVALPADVVAEASSVPNVLRNLKRSGIKARLYLVGDPAWDRAVLQIDLAPGRTGRFNADAVREGGRTTWSFGWAGNYGPTADRHRMRALKLPSYQLARKLVPVARV